MRYKSKIFLVFILALGVLLTGCKEEKQEEKTVAKAQVIQVEKDEGSGVNSAEDLERLEGEEPEEEETDAEEEAVTEETVAGTTVKTVHLKVATYNIAAGREVNYDYSVIAADIRNSGADIVALQEIDQVTLRNGSQDTMAILSAQTGMPYYEFAPALSPYQEGEYGIAILSKYPIDSYMYFDLPKGSEKEEQRVLLQAKIEVGGMMFDFFVTHGQQSSIRQQLAAANDYISSSTKFIYAGDFNTSNYSYFQAIANSYTIIGSENPMLTSANYSFDNMVISKNIQSSNVRTYNTGHSDHYMVLADVVIPVN